MDMVEQNGKDHLLLSELSKADTFYFLGHSIKTVIEHATSKDDLDWLVNELKEYAKESPGHLQQVIGNVAFEMILNYKPHIKC